MVADLTTFETSTMVRSSLLGFGFAVLTWVAPTAQAGPLIDALLGGNRYPPAYPVGAPVPVTSNMPPNPGYTSGYGSYYGGAVGNGVYPTNAYAPVLPNGFPQSVPAALPTAAYDSVWARNPVTYYRPVTAFDPRYGTTVTSLQPCTSYQYSAQRVPVIAPRAMLGDYGIQANKWPGITGPGYYPTGLSNTSMYPSGMMNGAPFQPLGTAVNYGTAPALGVNQPAPTLIQTNQGTITYNGANASIPANVYAPSSGFTYNGVPALGLPTYPVNSTPSAGYTTNYTPSGSVAPSVPAPYVPGAVSVTPVGPPTYSATPSYPTNAAQPNYQQPNAAPPTTTYSNIPGASIPGASYSNYGPSPATGAVYPPTSNPLPSNTSVYPGSSYPGSSNAYPSTSQVLPSSNDSNWMTTAPSNATFGNPSPSTYSSPSTYNGASPFGTSTSPNPPSAPAPIGSGIRSNADPESMVRPSLPTNASHSLPSTSGSSTTSNASVSKPLPLVAIDNQRGASHGSTTPLPSTSTVPSLNSDLAALAKPQTPSPTSGLVPSTKAGSAPISNSGISNPSIAASQTAPSPIVGMGRRVQPLQAPEHMDSKAQWNPTLLDPNSRTATNNSSLPSTLTNESNAPSLQGSRPEPRVTNPSDSDSELKTVSLRRTR